MLAITAFYEWNPIEMESDEFTAKDFHASNGFVHNFKPRHSFSSRRVHYTRRPSEFGGIGEINMRRWVREIKLILKERKNELSYVVNCDETCWRLYPNGILPWARRGANGVSLAIRGNEKAVITPLATITAENTKLPLFIIAKGKTKRVESTHLGPISEHRADHSPSGWTTEDTMQRYLTWLRERYPPVRTPDGEKALPIDLILDCYLAHMTRTVRSTAARLKIRLHFIPIGRTDKLQPLDRRIFGCLKATARAEYRRFSMAHPCEKIRTPDAGTMLRRSWDHLSLAAMEAAWMIYTRPDRTGPEDVEDDWHPDFLFLDDSSDDD
jgi:hypothetical protein